MSSVRNKVIVALRTMIAKATEPSIQCGLTDEQLLQSVALIPEESGGKVSLTLKNQSHEIISAIRHFQTNDRRVMDDPHAEHIAVANTDPVTGEIITLISNEKALDRYPIQEINNRAAYVFGLVTASGRIAGRSNSIQSTPTTITAASWDELGQAIAHVPSAPRRAL